MEPVSSASAGRWLAPADRPLAFWLFASFLFLYLLTSGGHFYASDDVQKFEVLRSLWNDGTVAIPGGWTLGRENLAYSWFSAGSTLLMLPGFVLGYAMAGLVPAVEAEFVARFLITLQNAFLSAALVTLVFGYVRYLGASVAGSLVSALALGLGTVVWPYARTAWSEPGALCFAFAGLFAWQVAANENFRRLGPVLLSGSAFAIGYAIRQETCLIAVGAVLATAWQHRKQLLPLVKAIPIFGLPVIPAIALNLAYNWARYGSATEMPNLHSGGQNIFDQPGLQGKVHWVVNNFYHYTINPNDSLLALSTPAFLGLLFWGVFWRRRKPEAMIMTGAVGLLAVFLVAIVWHPGWAWGLRFTYHFTPFFVIPLAFLWDSGNWRRLTLAVIGIGVAVQLVAVLHNFNYLYEAERRAYPGLPVMAIMSDPVHAPLWLAIKATPKVLAGGARILTEPPPKAGSVATYRSRAQDVPDWWAFLLLTTPMPRVAIAAAFLATLLGLIISVFQLRLQINKFPPNNKSPR